MYDSGHEGSHGGRMIAEARNVNADVPPRAAVIISHSLSKIY
jgi:hypothetical protein